MRVWNIGNTTVRNPQRLREALELFNTKMGGRPFRRDEQREFQGYMIDAGLVNSTRYDGDDGGRKFASAFKQLGFVTDWGKGKDWELTAVGRALIQHPQIEATIFLRQLLKYQIPSPLEERGTTGFHLRPFWLLLRFLKRAHDEGLVGLTKFEIGLFVITLLTEDATAFEAAFAEIHTYRTAYDAVPGKVGKSRFASERFKAAANALSLETGTFRDYADSNGRYALMSGLLSVRGNKLTIAESRLPFIEALLAAPPTFIADEEYLAIFYNPELPVLPSDDIAFLRRETALLRQQLSDLRDQMAGQAVGMLMSLPMPPDAPTLLDLQAYEQDLRDRLKQLREMHFYQEQRTKLAEIAELLEDIRDGNLFGGEAYAPAYFEWAVWRFFLAVNDIEGPISNTRGFMIDEDMQPIHHAKGGAADLQFTYVDFRLVCEMTLMSGSRQFAGEGEPVTRHVYKAVSDTSQPVYGLFVTNKLDPNTADAFHKARYWRDWQTPIKTSIVALTTEQVLAIIQHMQTHSLTAADIRSLLDQALSLQDKYEDGPSWYRAYSALFDSWRHGAVRALGSDPLTPA